MKTLLSALLILLCLNSISAQLPYGIHDRISVNRTVTAVAECGAFYWVGTNDGFMKINKQNQKRKTYTTENSILPAGHIRAICSLANGHVLIGTDDGVLVYDGVSYFLMNTDNTMLADNSIRYIIEDADATVWIATQSGLTKMIGNKFYLYNITVKEITNDKDRGYCFVTGCDQHLSAAALK
jgi:ligand-binding sensor domain-containing protein